MVAVVATASLFAQCSKPYFSEYVEGTGNNKALEIYNPTSTPINLNGYKVKLFANGSTAATTTFNLNAILAAGDVYVIVNNQANDSLKAKADTISGVTAFTGNDAVALLYGNDTIDIIGVVGTDPGANTGWLVDTANTINHTLIRRDTVTNGTKLWSVGAGEWYVLPRDTARLGTHTGPTNLTPCAAGVIDTLVYFAPTSGTFTGVNGAFDLNVFLSNVCVSSHTVDVQLTSGNAAWIDNYTTQSLVFAPDSIQKKLSLTITNDTTGGLSHTLTFKLVNLTGDVKIGNDSVFTLTLNAPTAAAVDTCGTLFFSEYVEGSANNKFLEIYNPLPTTVDLAGYKVQSYNNGADSASVTFNLSGSIAAGDVYVIAASQADSVLKLLADTTSGVATFNGNDAIALLYGTDTLDVIGVIGFNPGGAGWTVGTGTTNNHTLVRQSNVQKGNTNWSAAVGQWTSFPLDTIFLGSHTGVVNVNACALTPIQVGIKNIVNDNVSRIYPNPNNGTFAIELKNFTSSTEVTLYDLTGRIVYYSKETSNLIKVSLNQVNSGMYLVEVKSGNLVSRSRVSVQQ
jgi:hypothetical protein